MDFRKRGDGVSAESLVSVFESIRAAYDATRHSRFVRRRRRPDVRDICNTRNKIEWRGKSKGSVIVARSLSFYVGKKKRLILEFGTNQTEGGASVNEATDFKYVIRGLHRKGFRQIVFRFR